MGRRKDLPTTYDIFIIGEQLRCQMTSAGLIKDNRHHLRKHRLCFVAKDAIDWIVIMHHVDTRQEAVDAMYILQEFNVIRHVTDDLEFKDKNALFRFTKDDDTYKADRELQAFYRGLQIFNTIKKKGKDVIKNVYFKGSLHYDVFHGDDLVDFLQQWEGTTDRQEVVAELKDLLTRDVIKHLSDDCHFVDDKICYKFNVDFHKSCLLHEVLDIMDCLNSLPFKKTDGGPAPFNKDPINEPKHRTAEVEIPTNDTAKTTKTVPDTKRRIISPHPPQSQNERVLQLHCDNVGFGLTLRSSSPCYVHAISPLGPAAKAKVKVGHAVTSVNGHPVHHMDHKQVGILIAQCEAGRTPLRLGISLHPKKQHNI